jgi:hypothetical protein
MSSAADDNSSLRPLVRARPAPVAPHIRQVRLVDEEPLDTAVLASEFPTIEIEQASTPQAGDTTIDDFAWRGAFDLTRFEEAIENARGAPLAIRGGDAAGVACEVLSRYQRLIGRRNAASTTRLFDAVLHAHAALEGTAPLVKADVDHMRDTWQWLLRLDPAAGLRVQLAALVHEVDRFMLDPRERLEHRARGEGSREPRGGAERAVHLLREAGVGHEDVLVVRDILRGHPDHERDALLIDDADALTFLSLNSATYADHFGLAQTRRKVGHTVGRLGDLARRKLSLVRLRPDIARLLHGVAA